MLNENNHTVLATSSKEWVHCGYSTKFLATKEEETNDALEFGTECHVLAEAYIKQSLKIKDFDERTVSIDELKSNFKHYGEEMWTLATGYVNSVIGQADYVQKCTGKKTKLLTNSEIEELLSKLDFVIDYCNSLNHSNSDMPLMNLLAYWCNGDKEQIVNKLYVSRRTVYRWYEQGLKEIVVPPNNTCCGAFSKEFWNETSKLWRLGFLKSKICLLQSWNIAHFIKM